MISTFCAALSIVNLGRSVRNSIFLLKKLPYLFEQEKKVSNTVEKYGKRGKTRLINHTKSTYGIYSRSLLTWRIVDSAPNAVCC